MTQDNTEREYKSGLELLKAWGANTREAQLERACIALMSELNRLHIENDECDLSKNIHNINILCSCADAYRMGYAALFKGE